jgi:hypothetical protein
MIAVILSFISCRNHQSNSDPVRERDKAPEGHSRNLPLAGKWTHVNMDGFTEIVIRDTGDISFTMLEDRLRSGVTDPATRYRRYESKASIIVKGSGAYPDGSRFSIRTPQFTLEFLKKNDTLFEIGNEGQVKKYFRTRLAN